MKRTFATIFCVMASLWCGVAGAEDAEESGLPSRIAAVKLHRNQAAITRTARLRLREGMNRVTLGSLPPLLYDWSVRGSLPRDFSGSIVSMEVVKKALVQKKRKEILEIEEKLKTLRERDQVFVDELKIIQSQEKFLDSIADFTNQTVSRELMTRIPEVKVWDGTLTYTAEKRKNLLARKREIEVKRESIGREIQKWEFELSQIAGASYFDTYRTLNNAILTNRSSMQIQQFAATTDRYAEQKRILKSPTEKVDIEKRLAVEINAPAAGEADFSFTYVIPSTAWEMKYDVRADSAQQRIGLFVYGNIYQMTGENWENIMLSLSTGAPASAISPPDLAPWFLDVEAPYRSEEMEYDEGAGAERKSAKKKESAKADIGKQQPAEVEIRETGPYFEISFPVRQNITSSAKYQKKFIREFRLEDGKAPRFFYEAIPADVQSGYLKAAVKNTTGLPLLPGEAQIFLDNEFMGKASMPAMAPGMEEEIILGVESRIAARKELVKKYEEAAGIMGGKRRILYRYKLTVENRLPRGIDVFVYDALPLSRNDKIDVEIKNLSRHYLKDEEFEKTTRHAQGIRKWRLDLGAGAKEEITYDAVISFDKELTVRGMR
ncbi:MAG: hypothetical protein A2176_15045 [Spirochaetes bacterium RBG_13_51_14]|nr:MAG: hypothetical protein A2176_15045 [Spirochaetes bacterium RBG_13_51_14]